MKNAQGELFRVWRHHAVFTDSPRPMLDAEADHRRHTIIEQVIADLKNGPLAHLPSGSFAANSAWLVLAATAFNLTRAVGAKTSRLGESNPRPTHYEESRHRGRPFAGTTQPPRGVAGVDPPVLVLRYPPTPK